jgi:hypothetical protein
MKPPWVAGPEWELNEEETGAGRRVVRKEVGEEIGRNGEERSGAERFLILPPQPPPPLPPSRYPLHYHHSTFGPATPRESDRKRARGGRGWGWGRVREGERGREGEREKERERERKKERGGSVSERVGEGVREWKEGGVEGGESGRKNGGVKERAR